MSVVQVPLIIGAVIALACLYGSFHYLGRKRLIDDTPTSKTQGVFIGGVELKGTAESENPLVSYLAGARCVQYDWSIEEEWSRLVTETYRDAQGKTQTRTRAESGWTNVGGGGESPPFYLKDDTGILRIMPKGASIEGKTTLNNTLERRDPLYYNKGPANDIMNSTHRRRFSESVIPLHASIYVLGQAREREDVVAAEIVKDEKRSLFLISTESEKHISSEFRLCFYGFFIAGLAAASLGGFFTSSSPSVVGWLLPTFLYLAVAILGWLWTTYNNIVSLRNGVDHAWSLVDVQLKRRNYLIPSLASVVEGYSVHEKSVQCIVAELWAQASPSESRGVSSTLRAFVESYPDLRAVESFLGLQGALEETEQRIALARDYFNEIAFFYNTRLVIVPDSLVGRLARLKPRPLFRAENFERATVDAKLAD